MMQTQMSALNSSAAEVAELRTAWLNQYFPGGVPTLWCPSITHYDDVGNIDSRRISLHLAHLSPHVKGFLIPGSTSDGWELSDHEFWQLLDIAIAQAQQLKLYLLVGILKAHPIDASAMLSKVLERIRQRANQSDTNRALAATRVCGFAVCGPRGETVPQSEIERSLSSFLELGVPTALYQLPQMTRNEIGPEVVLRLSQRFSNFILFKDSSGADRTVNSGWELGGVFTMRGAEGDYARWCKAGGGRYDGFLLSTANCFGRELQELIAALESGRAEEARNISSRITGVINAMFEVLGEFRHGNIYANANKAIDHFFAHGPGAAGFPPPRIRDGHSLPATLIRQTGEVLDRHGLMPRTGYLK